MAPPGGPELPAPAALCLLALVLGQTGPRAACPWLLPVPSVPHYFDHELVLHPTQDTPGAAGAWRTLLGAAFCCGGRVRVIVHDHWLWRAGSWGFDFPPGPAGNYTIDVESETPTNLWPWYNQRFVGIDGGPRERCLRELADPTLHACQRALLLPSWRGSCQNDTYRQPEPADVLTDEPGPARDPLMTLLYAQALRAERHLPEGGHGLHFGAAGMSITELHRFRCATSWFLNANSPLALLLTVLDLDITRRVYERDGCRYSPLCGWGVRVWGSPFDDQNPKDADWAWQDCCLLRWQSPNWSLR